MTTDTSFNDIIVYSDTIDINITGPVTSGDKAIAWGNSQFVSKESLQKLLPDVSTSK